MERANWLLVRCKIFVQFLRPCKRSLWQEFMNTVDLDGISQDVSSLPLFLLPF